MTELYLFVKWLHIASAAIAFGSNITHLFWLMAANKTDSPARRAEILRLVKKIDDYMAIPAYIILVICGVTMWLWHWPLGSSWIITSLVLTLILAAMGVAFGPFMKRWIRIAGEGPDGPESHRLPSLTRALTIWWSIFVVSVPVVLYFMVFKPVFW
jgi:uncharacterized membrane protein